MPHSCSIANVPNIYQCLSDDERYASFNCSGPGKDATGHTEYQCWRLDGNSKISDIDAMRSAASALFRLIGEPEGLIDPQPDGNFDIKKFPASDVVPLGPKGNVYKSAESFDIPASIFLGEDQSDLGISELSYFSDDDVDSLGVGWNMSSEEIASPGDFEIT